MDGRFVPNLTFGHPVVKCLRKKIPAAFFDMHMMVAEPELWIQPMSDAGANQYTFHLEAATTSKFTAPEIVRKIKEAGMLAGVAVKPGTPVEELEPLLDSIDMALIMTVEPGFGGQSFMSDMMPKITWLRERCPQLDIEVDGGVSLATIGECSKAGANMIVSGSALMKSEDPRADMLYMKRQVQNAGLYRESTPNGIYW